MCLKLVSIRNRLNFLTWESQLRLFQHFCGHDSRTILPIQTKKLRADLHSLDLAWATTQIPSNSHRDCAYTNGFPVVAGGPYVVILQTSATNGSMSFLLWGREGFWLAGCLGFKPWMAVGIKPLQPGGVGRWGRYFSQRPPWLREGNMGHAVSFNYTLACTLQLKRITNNLHWDNWRVLGTVYSHSVHVNFYYILNC